MKVFATYYQNSALPCFKTCSFHDLEVEKQKHDGKVEEHIQICTQSTTICKMCQNGKIGRFSCFDHYFKTNFSRFKSEDKTDKGAWQTIRKFYIWKSWVLLKGAPLFLPRLWDTGNSLRKWPFLRCFGLVWDFKIGLLYMQMFNVGATMLKNAKNVKILL